MVTCLSKNFVIQKTDALLITDIQKDFLPGGALPIENGDEIVPVLNQYIRVFCDSQAHVVASRDWHPLNHVSFKARGGPWPPHCVQGTPGAAFNPDLKLPKHTLVISKATNPDVEAYSAFDATGLATDLKTMGVQRLFIGGLATDYCVVNTVVDACKLGFEVVVLMDAILGIDAQLGDVDRAIEKMLENGAGQASIEDFPDAVDVLPIEETQGDALAEKPLLRADVKKKARMRSKDSTRRIKTEH
jgi:nicotinamidase/pyrazinamidase